jgi:flagellar biosynthesis GTPase FlhF
MKSIVEEASSLAKAFSQAWERAGKPQECTVKILAEPEKNFIGMTTKSAKIAVFFNEVAPAQSKKGSTQSSSNRSSSSKHTPVQTQQQSRAQQPVRTHTERPRQESRPVEQRPTEQRSTEQRPVEQRSNEQRSTEQRPRQQRPIEQRSNEQRSSEQRPVTETPRTVTPREKSLPETTQIETATRPEGVAPTPRIRPIWTEEMDQAVRAWVQESLQIMSRTDVTFNTSMSRSMLTISFAAPLIEDMEKERLLFRSWSHLIVQHIKQEFKVHGKEFKIILKGSRTSL